MRRVRAGSRSMQKSTAFSDRRSTRGVCWLAWGFVGEEAAVDGEHQGFRGGDLLVAAGRTPNTDGLGLRVAGIETDESGFITVDASPRTSQANVWAIGDVVGPPMFTHSARDDADLLYGQLFKDRDATTAGRQVPYAIFTDPEIPAVGLTAEAAREAGYDVKAGKHPFTRVVRARAIGVGATYGQIARSLHIHPTLAEGINSAAGGVHRPTGDV